MRWFRFGVGGFPLWFSEKTASLVILSPSELDGDFFFLRLPMLIRPLPGKPMPFSPESSAGIPNHRIFYGNSWGDLILTRLSNLFIVKLIFKNGV